ncbi:unnamed protein product [Somion occarium]|uniref:Kinesin-like protein n=1 Tax=Somion occarium TaxID=3059160 RepID=A0ABP1CVU9_9APHY
MNNTRHINIVTRLRPPITNEVNDDGVRVTREGDRHFISVNNPRDLTQVFKYPFSSCYDQDSTQQEIFDNEVEPMTEDVYAGLTVTIFAYGVTSSGKTHTMQGTKSDPGIIPRAVESLFQRKRKQANVTLAISYMEIYKDEVYDLLIDRENAPKLPVRENGAGQVFVANLSSQVVDRVEEFHQIYSEATLRRSVASTNLNRASSRSHAILTITVTISDPTLGKALSGKLNLVDLAGSENNKVKSSRFASRLLYSRLKQLTGNDPSRMAESSAINKSLSVLGQVVHALNQGASRIPYRNSKLTRILQDALGGSSVGLLICNIAPAPKYRQDTLNTLNFATRTRNIENKPVINEKDLKPAPKPPMSRRLPQAPARRPSEVPSGLTSRIARPSLTHGPSRSSLPSSTIHSEPVTVNVNIPPQNPPPAPGLTEEEIDARIAKAVETEVARRLAEHEKQKAIETESRVSLEEGPSNSSQKSPVVEDPSSHIGHMSVDEDLRQRLAELEQKFETGNSELRMVSDLSPASRKRTGRAYVALARAQSEKNNLALALELYRKAEAYVPDNVKLKERIIEIEWAVKNGKPFKPSPKKPRKKKTKKTAAAEKSRATGSESVLQDSRDENNAPPVFGSSLLVGSTTASFKRQAEGSEIWETPKRRYKKIRASIEQEDDDE